MKNKEFEICVRAIIFCEDKILICKNKKKDYYFFPGGHIDFGEEAKTALFRELKEELNISIKEYSFIGVVENIYIEDNQKHHELNLVFNVEAKEVSDKSREDHIDFFFMGIDKFSQEKVFPITLQKVILKWLKNKKTDLTPFFHTTGIRGKNQKRKIMNLFLRKHLLIRRFFV